MSDAAPASASASSAAPADAQTSKTRGKSATGKGSASSVSGAAPASAVSDSMQISDGGEADDTRAKKMEAATKAASTYMADQLATLKGRYTDMHSSSQVLLLKDEELWDTIAANWGAPGKEKITAIVNSWDGMDLAACVYRLSLPVLPIGPNYKKVMRRSIIDAVRSYAQKHPELFDEGGEEDSEGGEPEPEEKKKKENKERPSTPPRASSAAPKQDRRSPRELASSRSAAAAAVAALTGYVPPPKQTGGAAGAGASSSGSKSAPKSSRGSSRAAASSPAPLEVDLSSIGGDSGEESEGEGEEEEEEEWELGEEEDDPLSASVRRGGRLRREEMEHALARAGVERSFARGFIRNARSAAGGRSMYQLYVDVTSNFKPEARHSKRECLALSRILDALLRKDYKAALEHTCRRLGGVHTAAETDNWEMCERLETEAEQRSFVPDVFMRSALRSVTQMQAVKKSVSNRGGGNNNNYKGGAGGYGSSSGKGRGGDYRSKSNRKDGSSSSDAKGSGASSSFKKKKGGSAD
jgi:hypothetical protein